LTEVFQAADGEVRGKEEKERFVRPVPEAEKVFDVDGIFALLS